MPLVSSIQCLAPPCARRSRICHRYTCKMKLKTEYIFASSYGALQRETIQKIRDNFGSGCPCLILTKIIIGKSSQNGPILTLIFRGSISCVFSGTLLKIVSLYDLSVLPISVVGFQKRLDRGVGGALYIFWGIF